MRRKKFFCAVYCVYPMPMLCPDDVPMMCLCCTYIILLLCTTCALISVQGYVYSVPLLCLSCVKSIFISILKYFTSPIPDRSPLPCRIDRNILFVVYCVCPVLMLCPNQRAYNVYVVPILCLCCVLLLCLFNALAMCLCYTYIILLLCLTCV